MVVNGNRWAASMVERGCAWWWSSYAIEGHVSGFLYGNCYRVGSSTQLLLWSASIKSLLLGVLRPFQFIMLPASWAEYSRHRLLLLLNPLVWADSIDTPVSSVGHNQLFIYLTLKQTCGTGYLKWVICLEASNPIKFAQLSDSLWQCIMSNRHFEYHTSSLLL